VSASSILAQAVPNLLVAFPGWRAPTFMHLRATIGATGAATMVAATDAAGRAGTTPGLTLTRVSAGVYDIVHPPCRSVAYGTLGGTAGTVSAGSFVTADPRVIGYDKSTTNTNATTGKMRIVFANGTAINTELGNGQEVNVSFWADLG
jgi:hypothetical protein